MIPEVDKSSFLDPSGFMFYHEGISYRQINPVYKEGIPLVSLSHEK
jgi:hypothetical protein